MSAPEARRRDVTMPDGETVTAWRRSAWQILEGDFLPDHGASALAPSVYDETTRRHLVALDDGRDVELTRRAKVWLVRDYRGRSWLSSAAAAYREDVAARDALRESDALAPTTVAGISGTAAAMYQLDAETFEEHVPRPRWADYVREYAPRHEAMA